MMAEKMKRKKVLKNAKMWNMCDKIGTRGIVCAHAAYKNKHVNVARSARAVHKLIIASSKCPKTSFIFVSFGRRGQKFSFRRKDIIRCRNGILEKKSRKL